jgi:hypothetical protein
MVIRAHGGPEVLAEETLPDPVGLCRATVRLSRVSRIRFSSGLTPALPNSRLI